MPYDAALLDELAMCFVEAALRELETKNAAALGKQSAALRTNDESVRHQNPPRVSRDAG